ncbi:MAG TPA: hypothetical protein VIS99_17680 [Terrimicrobiaceae bacterium]
MPLLKQLLGNPRSTKDVDFVLQLESSEAKRLSAPLPVSTVNSTESRLKHWMRSSRHSEAESRKRQLAVYLASDEHHLVGPTISPNDGMIL